MENDRGYLIVNVTRGWFDGHYFKKSDAEEMLAYWASEFPSDYVVMAKIENAQDPIGERKLPDNRFMHSARKMERA